MGIKHVLIPTSPLCTCLSYTRTFVIRHVLRPRLRYPHTSGHKCTATDFNPTAVSTHTHEPATPFAHNCDSLPRYRIQSREPGYIRVQVLLQFHRYVAHKANHFLHCCGKNLKPLAANHPPDACKWLWFVTVLSVLSPGGYQSVVETLIIADPVNIHYIISGPTCSG